MVRPIVLTILKDAGDHNLMKNLPVKSPVQKRKFPFAALAMAGLLTATSLAAYTTLQPATPANAQSIFNNAPAEGFADLVEKVMPAVISVEVSFTPAVSDQNFGDDHMEEGERHSYGQGQNQRRDHNQGSPGQGEFKDGPFKHFFERFGDRRRFQPNRPHRRNGQGSGFIISKDGYAVTNNHVVAGATEVKIKMNDGKSYRAKVVGTDPKTDLALIKIMAKREFKFVEFADKAPRVGDWVVAVGNPFGLGGTVTTGIISAQGRNIGQGPYDNFLQIDAAINKGNSGGPAFNLKGQVIGVNTAIFSPSGASAGIGFAIPASITKQVIEDLKNNGVVTRGWLGVQIQPVTEDIAESLGLKDTKGTIVVKVTKGSPADKAGLKSRDTILKVKGVDVKGPRELARHIAMIKPGESVAVTILRDGKQQDVNVKIGTLPGQQKRAQFSNNNTLSKKATLRQLGFRVEPSRNGTGVVVSDVRQGSPAAKKNLRPGDVIIEINGVAVNDPEALRAALGNFTKEGKKSVLFLVRSGERNRFVALPVGKS